MREYAGGFCNKHWRESCEAHAPEVQGHERGQSAEFLDAVRPRGGRIPECGHPDRKHRARGMCNSCYMVWWMREHPDANTGNNWRELNPGKAADLKRRTHLRRRLGLTPEQYEQMWRQQEGRCANAKCGAPFPLTAPDYRHALQVDHCHRSGAIRGLLCASCNRILGCVDDDPAKIAGLIRYLAASHA